MSTRLSPWHPFRVLVIKAWSCGDPLNKYQCLHLDKIDILGLEVNSSQELYNLSCSVLSLALIFCVSRRQSASLIDQWKECRCLCTCKSVCVHVSECMGSVYQGSKLFLLNQKLHQIDTNLFIGIYLLDHCLFAKSPKCTRNKNIKIRLQQAKECLCNEQNTQQSEETAYQMGENICQTVT